MEREILQLQGLVLTMGMYALALTLEQEEQEEERRERRSQRRRRRWTKDCIQRRQQLGAYHRLLRELQLEDVASFTNFMSVTPKAFNELLGRVGPRIQKQHTNWRNPLAAGLKLAVTLRYLATGDSYQDLGDHFKLTGNSISLFLPEVCQAILDEYSDKLLSCPVKPEGWKQVAAEFATRWNVPNCCGALDGRHVSIKNPSDSGPIYYNYKGFYSIILVALADANHKFLYVECGFNETSLDGEIFSRTELCEYLENGGIGLPPAEPLPGGDKDVPYFIVGNESFPLKTWFMKPLLQRNMTIKQKVYDYRLSRARSVVDNAFGLLSARFRCLLTTMPQKPETATTIVLAACCLHNLLIEKSLAAAEDRNIVDHENPETHEVVPGTWRDQPTLTALGDSPRKGGNLKARAQRDYLVEYFNSEAGSVPWQLDRI